MTPEIVIYYGCVMGNICKFAGQVFERRERYVDIYSGPGKRFCVKAEEARPPRADEKVTMVNGYWRVEERARVGQVTGRPAHESKGRTT